ncbi:MAG: hypothetical protein RL662_1095 [Bacteroidota bacterium]|jgi:hypothetical protein
MITRNLLYLASLAVFIVGSPSCSKNKVIPKDKMAEVLYDIQLAETIHQVKYEDFKTRQQKDALIEGVLLKHGITQAQLDSSLVWYSDNVEVYTRVNDSIIATLKRESVVITQKASSLGLQSRQASLIPTYFYVSNGTPTLAFNLDSLQIPKYPDFSFKFNTLWLPSSTDAEFAVTFIYADTLITESRRLTTTDVQYVIAKPQLDKTLKHVSGYIHLNSQKIPEQKILLYNILLTDSIKQQVNIPTGNDSIK